MAAEKSEFGLYGVVGGKMVVVMLAGKMRLERGRIAAVEDDVRQTYTVKHIRKGLTLLSLTLLARIKEDRYEEGTRAKC